MRNASRSMRLACVVLFLSLLDGRSAQAPPEPVTRFREVKSYSLFVQLKSDDDMNVNNGTGESLKRKFKEELVARIDLTERHLDNDYVEWSGEGFAEQILQQEHKEVHANGYFVKEVKSVAKGNSKTKAKLVIDELQKTFQVIVDTEYVTGTESGYRKDDPKPTESISGPASLVTTAVRWLQTYPLPGAGLALNVDKPYPMEQCGTYCQDFDWLRIHGDHAHKGRLEIALLPPEADQPKLILTPPANYSRWRPTPDPTNPPHPRQPVNVAAFNTPNNATDFMLQIRVPNLFPSALRYFATLQVQNRSVQNRSGKKGEEELAFGPFDVTWQVFQTGRQLKVVKVTFQLSEVSKFPGSCMNFPAVPTPDEPDLDFVPPSTHADWSLNRSTQTLTIKDQTAQSARGTIQLKSLDGAAIGVLTAEAKLEGRTRPVVAEIRGNQQSGRLLIPDRDEGEEIARGWKSIFGRNMGDSADEDNKPEGNGQKKGDGLTVWEEYRGFFVGGQWTDCDPRKKDLFIENLIVDRVQAGMDLFGKVTGIVVHDKLIPNKERRADRVINFNKRSDRYVADQHCLVIRLRPTPDKDDKSTSNIEGDFLDELILGVDMGPPKNVEWVNISPRMLNKSTVAHELSHAVGVHHHGEGDKSPVEWEVKDVNGKPQLFEAGKPIKVLNEALERVLFEQIFFDYSRGERKREVYLGTPQGLHSGYENCWMRYNLAHAYVYRVHPEDTRIWPRPETEPSGLCSSEHGITFNKEGPGGNKPHARYGSAANGRGDCIHQIVVSDRWDATSR